MQEYLNAGKCNNYQLHDALEIFKDHTDIADRIYIEFNRFLDNPRLMTKRINWHDDFIGILHILKISYESKRDYAKSLNLVEIIKKVERHENDLNNAQKLQADAESARIKQKIEQQLVSLSSKQDIEPNLIAKLSENPPVLPWELNPKYENGPFRMGIKQERIGIQEYKITAIIPLFKKLSDEFTELMKAACSNPERLPADHIVRGKAIVWQQQLFQDELAFRLPQNVLQALLASNPQLPWELNKDNASVPGYSCTFDGRGERYITIPLRKELLEKYPALMQAADQNKQSRPVPTTNQAPESILFRRESVHTSAAPATRQAAEQAPARVYDEIQKAIGNDSDIIDNLSFSDKPMLICPLTHCIMRDPVILGTTGQTFERQEIVMALKNKPGENPLDNSRLTNSELAPSDGIRYAIIDFVTSDAFKKRLSDYRNDQLLSTRPANKRF